MVLVSGERRLTACKQLNKDVIPGIFIESDKYDEIALVDNVQRADLHPIDEAEAIVKLRKKYNYTQEQLGNLIGKAPNTISDIEALGTLPDEIRDEARKIQNISRSALLRIARQRKVPIQKKSFEKLKEALSNTGKVKKTKRAAYLIAIEKTEHTIKLFKDINLNKLGTDKSTVGNKLKELQKSITELLSKMK